MITNKGALGLPIITQVMEIKKTMVTVQPDRASQMASGQGLQAARKALWPKQGILIRTKTSEKLSSQALARIIMDLMLTKSITLY